MWFIYAFLGAVFAAMVTIIGKLGLKSIDPAVATTVRAIIMAIFLVVVTMTTKMQDFNLHISRSDAVYITLSGIFGALSWLMYFTALKLGPAGKTAIIDRFSLVLIIIFSALFFKESFGWKNMLGLVFIMTGIILSLG